MAVKYKVLSLLTDQRNGEKSGDWFASRSLSPPDVPLYFLLSKFAPESLCYPNINVNLWPLQEHLRLNSLQNTRAYFSVRKSSGSTLWGRKEKSFVFLVLSLRLGKFSDRAVVLDLVYPVESTGKVLKIHFQAAVYTSFFTIFEWSTQAQILCKHPRSPPWAAKVDNHWAEGIYTCVREC